MAHELFRRIPETAIHRYECHVWQKLFELHNAEWKRESVDGVVVLANNAFQGN
ncbi:hypothetical protein G3M48_000502 [Beauveria asiatica]|uniref:Uncharacterized protein n=1 Tax=Beauveria asiatica TaxID=1069075 RepID=A0AAW0S7N8_9HYPO